MTHVLRLKSGLRMALVAAVLMVNPGNAWSSDAGPYARGDETDHSVDPAIPYYSPDILGWASGWRDYHRADGGAEFNNPALALGPASNSIYSVVSLGDLDVDAIAAGARVGEITLTFEMPIGNGSGFDFAVFENGFANNFCELAYVEVSTDGVHFARFPSEYQASTTPVGGYAFIDVTRIRNLAGKHKVGFGTPFDLNELAEHPLVQTDLLDLDAIHYVRIVDIPGSGDWSDSFGNPIYDSWPTYGSGGFDLNGVAVLNSAFVAVPRSPRIVRVQPGSEVTFRVEALGASSTPQYQWYRSGGDKSQIPLGDNMPWLTLTAAPELDAVAFWCEVSDAGRTVVSPHFTLLVSAHLPASGMFGLLILALALAVLTSNSVKVARLS